MTKHDIRAALAEAGEATASLDDIWADDEEEDEDEEQWAP
jgi:hypothetical protein